MKTITIEGNVRDSLGTKHAAQLRREEQVPCVAYGSGEPIHFHAHKNAFKGLIFTAGKTTAELKLGDKTIKAIVKETQYHPVNDKLLHMDFQELIPGKKVITELPIKIHGRSVGVAAGGKLQEKMRRITVKCAPEELVEFVMVDISPLEIGQSMRVRDIEANYPNIQVMHHGAIPVCSVARSRVSVKK